MSTGHWYLAGHNLISVHYSTPYHITMYIRDYGAYFHMTFLWYCPQEPLFWILHLLEKGYTAAGKLQNKWRHLDGCGAFDIQVTYPERYSFLVRYWDEDDSKPSLAALLALLRCRPTVPHLVSIDSWWFLGSAVAVYIITRRAYWLLAFQFEVLRRQRQTVWAWWNNVKLISTQSPKKVKYYRVFPKCWVRCRELTIYLCLCRHSCHIKVGWHFGRQPVIRPLTGR